MSLALLFGVLGIAIGWCIGASIPSAPSFAAEAAELARLRRFAKAYDDRLDDAGQCPDGDDYNAVISEIGYAP